MPRTHVLRVLPAVLALLPCAGRAGAQEAADTVPVLLEPITVTVLRTPAELRTVPFAVSANTAEEVRRARPGLALDEALRGIPGVQVDNRYNYALGERISIRGFGARAQFGVRGIKVIVDGIPATFPDGQTSLSHLDLAFLERAEVVRGPASSIWGNTAGGVIQLETVDPPDRPFAQRAGVVAGADGLLRLHAAAGGRSGASEYQVGASRVAYDGYRDFSEAENLRAHARLGWRGTRDELRLQLSAVGYDALNPGSLSDSLLRVDRRQAYRNNRAQRTGEEGSQGQLGLVWRRATGSGGWEASGYLLRRDIENPIPASIIDLDRSVGGVRAAYGADPRGPWRLAWTAGAEAHLQRDDRRNFANDAGAAGALTLDQRERVLNAAGFAQATLEPTDRLTLMAGARYDWFRFEARDRLIAPGDPDDSGEIPLDALSPAVGASLALSDAVRVYANLATSFETPTTTELANRPSGAGGLNPELEPQEAVSAEVGAKGGAGRWLVWQVAAYRAEIENSLIAFEVPDAPGRQFFRNAGSARHRGVEAAATLAPLPGVRLEGAYTLTDARFRDYRVGDDVYDGNRVPGVAPHRVEAIASASLSGGWFAAVEGRWQSRVAVNDGNTVHSPAYTVVDARAGVNGVRLGRLEVDPFAGVTNLFDAEYNASVVVNAFGRRYFEPAPGRALYVGAEVRI